MLLCLILIPVIYTIIKIGLYIFVKKYGKFTYKDFDAAGFKYDSKQDVFYSSKTAWQKNFGYTHLYDVAAPIGRIIVDTEPIRFFYNNKNWLITFWKGQYGITSGAEIGIYNTTENRITKNTIYLPIEDSEMLDMEFVLFKKKEIITTIKDKHWWLAVFKLGMFSKPHPLTMDIKIKFPNTEMLNAFLSSFKKLHHSKKSYYIIDNEFFFKFKRAHTRKVWTRCWLIDIIRQHYNKKNVDIYNKYLSDVISTNNNSDKQIFIKNYIPEIFQNENTLFNKESDLIINKNSSFSIFRDDIYSNIKDDLL